MGKRRYPEWGRREMMLWAIHEWCQDRPAGENMIWGHQVATLVGGGKFIDNPWTEDPDEQAALKFQAEQINLFITLVREGLIDAKILRPIAGQQLTQAIVRGLHKPGLEMIQELPDPQRSLIEALDGIAEAIRNSEGVTEEERDAAAKAAEELKQFMRTAAPAATIQAAAAWFRSFGG